MARKTYRATQGSDEVTDGTTRFPVNPVDHTVELPEEVAERLAPHGGFVEITEPVPAGEGQTALCHPDGASCSFDGVVYEPDESGVVIVPSAAAAALASHGFAPAMRTVPAPEPETPAED